MSLNDYIVISVLLTGMVLSVLLKKLTLMAAITGGVVGLLVYTGAGFTGIWMMAGFFILGTVATTWNVAKKVQLNAAEVNNGQRKASQVLANAGVGALAGAICLLYPAYQPALQVVIAASFCSATADTLSSELGTIYGKNFYNILTLRKDQRGLDGVVSLEGTLIGVAGSAIIAFIYCLKFGWPYFGWLIVCGTIGNLADSVLGAALERHHVIKNDTVNFLNTLIAGAAAFVIYLLSNDW
ncbi:DUF92 domain-containing protein [Mucilaginibacter sp. Bleaf8]|uniref:DUF92 domain-containing protein n=1 Tax=Mucilaginibacter sp. Bleaf8 TaxID=2834430 RepID=UPI001BCF8970|nr:DUF92 domain-containing protein [Mucilaginibacter sp. Bleaf8]MBS7563219.1 DUF92 domain-containing protein [Mucilaginibacter sp. Bleaf8]